MFKTCAEANGTKWGPVPRLCSAGDPWHNYHGPLHTDECCCYSGITTGPYTSADERAGECYSRESKAKNWKNSETWSLGKKVLYSSITFFIQIHGKKLPKSISICASRGNGEGDGRRVPNGSLIRFTIMLCICPILFPLAVAAHLLGYTRKPEGWELGRDQQKSAPGKRTGMGIASRATVSS